MKMRFAIVAVGLLCSAPSAFAAGYGDAGCGFGSMIFGNTPNAMGQTSAATTNQSSFTQASAITSGTSNCDTTGIVLAEKAPEVFVAKNYASLVKDMATGQGEHLVAFAGLLGCSVEASAQLVAFTHTHYSAVVSGDSEPAQTLAAIRAGIASDPSLAASCRN